MTLKERINDKTKIPLAEEFVSEIRKIAEINNRSEDEIYTLWRNYSRECDNRDQSAVLFEFLDWNKLKGE